MGNFSRHADGLTERRMRMNCLGDVDDIGTQFDGKADLADQVSGVGSDNAATDAAVRLGFEQELGEAFVPAVGDGPA